MYKEKEAELDRQDSLDALEEERDVAKARSAFYQQQARSTGQNLQRWRTSSMPAREEKEQAQAQIGRSLHY